MPVTPDDHLAQSGFDVRVEWGPNGLRRLAPHCHTGVIVDVLSFTTCVDVALGRGATVLPYRWHDGAEAAHASPHAAALAVPAQETQERAAAWPDAPSKKAMTKSISTLRKAASDEMLRPS